MEDEKTKKERKKLEKIKKEREKLEKLKKEREKLEKILKYIDDFESTEGEIVIGGFGKVTKVRSKHNKKEYAIKVIYDESKKEKVTAFRGKNIIKISKEYEGNIKNVGYYNLYLMEYSYIGNLEKLIGYIRKNNKNRIFSEPFVELMSDNLLRYLIYQIITAMKTFYLGNLVHCDIKPTNFVCFHNLKIKLIDFGSLKMLDDKKEDIKKLSQGTKYYVTPEFYSNYNESLDDEALRSQDYFAIGATIFYLKYWVHMIKFFEGENDIHKKIENESTEKNEKKKLRDLKRDMVTLSISEAMNYIRTRKYQDRDFDDFLCNLIQFKPNDRPDFEKILRNKWLNKNLDEIDKILGFKSEGGNYLHSHLITEFQKSDFLINNVRHFRENFEKTNDKNDKLYINNRRGKFKFGKKIKTN